MASTVSVLAVGVSSYCHPGRHANELARCWITPCLNLPELVCGGCLRSQLVSPRADLCKLWWNFRMFLIVFPCLGGGLKGGGVGERGGLALLESREGEGGLCKEGGEKGGPG